MSRRDVPDLPMRSALYIGASVVVLDALVIAPIMMRAGWSPPWIALEAPAMTLLFALLPRTSPTWRAGWVAGLLVTLAVVLELTESAVHMVLARPLNLLLDVRLAPVALDLVISLLGGWWAVGVVVSLIAGFLAVWTVAASSLIAVRGHLDVAVPRLVKALVAAVCLIAVSGAAELPGGSRFGAGLPVVASIRDQLRAARATRAEVARFSGEVESVRQQAPPRAPARLAGVDVIVVFVESYGVTAIEDPRYAGIVGPRLRELGRRVEAAGLHMASGLLDSPTRGGQSWLAHGTLLSGLWLDDQLRYDLMLDLDAPTLIDDFRASGHRTIAVMPAITRPWLAGRRFGYDEIHRAGTMEYAGPPLNWVTMPDQYTLSWFERRVRGRSDTPVFAEIALISSHAPWTPVLPVVEDWHRIGDGRLFSRWHDLGPRPDVLWRDPERLGRWYARTLDYTLSVLAGYAERYVDRRTLLVVLGDHQPAPLITGPEAASEVPVHVISASPDLVAAFERRGFRPGALPDTTAGTPPRLSVLRSWFRQAFIDPPPRRDRVPAVGG